MDCQVNFAVILFVLVAAFNQQKTELTGIRAEREVAIGRSMRVVPARSGRIGCKLIAMRCARRNHRRAFFHGPVVERVDCEPMPVDDIAIGAGVRYINGNRNTLAQPEQRTWNLPVIRHSFDRDTRANVERAWLNAQAVIGLPRRTGVGCEHARHQRMQ